MHFVTEMLLLLFVISYCGVSAGTDRCDPDMFACTNGQCIPSRWKCDGEPDCHDKSDELNCAVKNCEKHQFLCGGNTCIPSIWKCDGQLDCRDGSDEAESICNGTKCQDDFFKCGDPLNTCIQKSWVCDMQPDCPNEEDEKSCDKDHCRHDQFQCADGKCIEHRWVCDSDKDCLDGSDERNCTAKTCRPDQFQCATTNECIRSGWRCDNDKDCADGSDEMNCTKSDIDNKCGPRDFMCASNGECISKSWQCDGEGDCPDDSDELNCHNTCRPDQFKCATNLCIPSMLKCNGLDDCGDGSDEKSCPLQIEKCNPKTEFACQKDGTSCIPISKFCNGHYDCTSKEDEPSNCKNIANPCVKDNGGCAHKCSTNKAGALICSCRPGYQLQGNKTCVDVDECATDGMCSQKCTNLKGSYHCSCPVIGYRIDPYQTHKCKATGPEPEVLIADRKHIHSIRFRQTSILKSYVKGTTNAVALDFDVHNKKVFWSDTNDEAIYWGDITKNNDKNLLMGNVSVPDGIAYDWVYNNIYWTDTGKNVIEVARFDGKLRSVLINTDMDEPRSIALNPVDGWMFWTDWSESNPRIERSGMNGKERMVIIQQDVSWPNGLTIDFVQKRLYWVDAKLHLIASSNFNGRETKVIYTSQTNIKHPFSITVFEDYVLWSDWGDNKVKYASKFNGTEAKVFTELDSPMALQVMHPVRQPLSPNHCALRNGGCAQLCLPAPQITPKSPKFSCKCMIGYTTKDDGITCTKDVAGRPSTPTGSPKINPENDSRLPIASSRPAYVIDLSANQNGPIKKTRAGKGENEVTYNKQTKNTPSISESTAGMNSEVGKIAGIVIGVLLSVVIIAGVIAFIIYRQYTQKSVRSMNFDNPVYRKTTEDTVSLEKNQYQPSRILPSTLEPLNQPTTDIEV